MGDFPRELAAAATEQLLLQRAMAERDEALANAWRARPRGMTWKRMKQLLDQRLPAEARLSVDALRHAVRRGNGGTTPPRDDVSRETRPG